MSNVTVQGNMFLNVSVAAILRANPRARITVSILNCTFRAGALLLIDSLGYVVPFVAVSRQPPVSITIAKIITIDGGTAIAGTFPPRTTILVQDSVMSISNNSIAPKASFLDVGGASNFGKLICLANLSLTTDSSLHIARSALVVLAPFNDACFPVLFVGYVRLEARSSLAMLNSTIFSSARDAVAIWFTPITMSGGSQWIFDELRTTASSAISLDTSPISMQDGSQWIITNVSMSASIYTTIWVNGPVSLAGGSMWSIAHSSLRSADGYGLYLTAKAPLSIDRGSQWIMVNSELISSRISGLAISSPIVVQNSSWVLWAGLGMNAPGTEPCVLFGGAPLLTLRGAAAVMSFVDSNCTTGGALMAGANIAGTGLFFQRCNRLNGLVTTSGSGLPNLAVSAAAADRAMRALTALGR
jgi:hypothetical protein